MSGYVSKLEISNYKNFPVSGGPVVEFNMPTGNPGSGLTILIGDNGSGKTALISAFSKLKDYSNTNDEERFEIDSDISLKFHSQSGTICELITTGDDMIVKSDPSFDLSFTDIEIIKDNRIWKSDFSSIHEYAHTTMQSEFDFKRTMIDERLSNRFATISRNNNIESSSDFKKKDRINGFLKDIFPDFSDWSVKSTPHSGFYISYNLKSGRKLSIDFSLGSGMLNIFKIVLALAESTQVILIDEPEAFLHPIAQINLSKLLIEESKNRQIIISTHSPYIFKDPVQERTKLLIFKNGGGTVIIQDASSLGWGLFGQFSPTWGEINYFAYDMPTIEFHNELYGYVQAQAIMADPGNYSESSFDQYIFDRLDPPMQVKRLYIREEKELDPSTGKQRITNCQRTLPTYIRNLVHHPENRNNTRFTDDELRGSTETLIKMIRP